MNPLSPQNTFTRCFGYFEMHFYENILESNYYMSPFPSDKTQKYGNGKSSATPPQDDGKLVLSDIVDEKLGTKGKFLFSNISDVNYDTGIDEFMCFLSFLKENNFGWYDFFGYLLPKTFTEYLNKLESNIKVNVATILIHLSALYISECVDVDNKNHFEVKVRSVLDPNYCTTMYLRGTSAPQVAMDLFHLFYNPFSKKYHVIVGEKKKSHTTTFTGNKMMSCGTDSSSDIVKEPFIYPVLHTGLHGKIPGPGEHADGPEEKKTLTTIAEEYQMICNSYGNGDGYEKKIMDCTHKDRVRAIVDRMCKEEGGGQGLVKSKYATRIYYLGTHTTDPANGDTTCRDPRYGAHLFTENFGVLSGEHKKFGWERKSSSHVFVFMHVLDTDENLLENNLVDPTDAQECGRSIICDWDFLKKEFHATGQLPPAFESHKILIEMVDCVKSVMIDDQ